MPAPLFPPRGGMIRSSRCNSGSDIALPDILASRLCLSGFGTLEPSGAPVCATSEANRLKKEIYARNSWLCESPPEGPCLSSPYGAVAGNLAPSHRDFGPRSSSLLWVRLSPGMIGLFCASTRALYMWAGDAGRVALCCSRAVHFHPAWYGVHIPERGCIL